MSGISRRGFPCVHRIRRNGVSEVYEMPAAYGQCLALYPDPVADSTERAGQVSARPGLIGLSSGLGR